MPRLEFGGRLAVLVAVLAGGSLVDPTRASACYDASQQQLFPLGSLDGDLLALRLVESRGGDELVHWTVATALVRISTDSRVTVLTQHKSQVFSDSSDYANAMKRLLHKTAREVAKRRGYRAIAMGHRVQCDNRKTCGTASLSARGADLVISTPGGVPTVVLGTQLDALYADPRNYEIAQMRSYRGAGGAWVLVDIRTGDARCSSIVNQTAAELCARRKSVSLPGLAVGKSYERRDSHHHGFDKSVVVWQVAKSR